MSWTGLVPGLVVADAEEAYAVLDHQASFAAELSAQISCRPVVVHFDLADPVVFASVPAFASLMRQPTAARAAAYADSEWRKQARHELAEQHAHRWTKTTVVDSAQHPELIDGPSIAALAAQRRVDPTDLLLDLALEDQLATRFKMVFGNDDDALLARLLHDDRTLLALSDAGAHANQLCDACYSTHLLGHWVRETGTLTLEQAVWRLTGQPARTFGLSDRGRIMPGNAADLVAFDPNTVGTTAIERVWDLPAGADRLLIRSTGIEHVWVNGVAIRRDGEDINGARPGQLLRAGSIARRATVD